MAPIKKCGRREGPHSATLPTEKREGGGGGVTRPASLAPPPPPSGTRRSVSMDMPSHTQRPSREEGCIPLNGPLCQRGPFRVIRPFSSQVNRPAAAAARPAVTTGHERRPTSSPSMQSLQPRGCTPFPLRCAHGSHGSHKQEEWQCRGVVCTYIQWGGGPWATRAFAHNGWAFVWALAALPPTGPARPARWDWPRPAGLRYSASWCGAGGVLGVRGDGCVVAAVMEPAAEGWWRWWWWCWCSC